MGSRRTGWTSSSTRAEPRRPRTPALYLLDEGRWIAVASNGGSDWEPGWWLNLRAGSPASVKVDGVTTPVVGVEVDGAERDRPWIALNKMYDYQSY